MSLEMQYQREVLAFREKIALAKLEESKAGERVSELEYEQARFEVEFFAQMAKINQQAMAQQQQPPAPPAQ